MDELLSFTMIALCGLVLLSSFLTVYAPSPFDNMVKVNTVKNDMAFRQNHTVDLKPVADDSKIISVVASFSLHVPGGGSCVLILNESHLDGYAISDPFMCNLTDAVFLNEKGIHALQTRLNSDRFNFSINSIFKEQRDPVPSNLLNLDVDYQTLRHIALIESDKIKNIVMSDDVFLLTLAGQYLDVTGLKVELNQPLNESGGFDMSYGKLPPATTSRLNLVMGA